MFGFLGKIFGTAQSRKIKGYRRVVAEINRLEEELQGLSNQEVKGKTAEFRERLGGRESLDDLLPEAYAVVKNVCRRLLGSEVHVSGYSQKWDMVPYDVQIIGAISMHQGAISEMRTGEGKTVTATMPLYLNALKGEAVHLVTVNDYLANRDCEWVGSILRWLGLTTGALTNQTALHERGAIYDCDVVYGTASEFGFDYLRDNSIASTKEEQVQKGHFFAIVDEIDSILIDEARTPLIISGPVPESRQMYGELKGGVAALVRTQQNLCNRMAGEVQKELEGYGCFQAEGIEKFPSKAKRALEKLWTVGRGRREIGW